MTLFVGLGNPGEKYVSSRHNAGFMLADVLAQKSGVSWQNQRRIQGLLAQTDRFQLLKPQTYMNGSGESVQAALRYYQPGLLPKNKSQVLQLSQLYVAFDDLDIPAGSWKVQFGKGPKVHNGLLSVYQHLGTEQFWHVRLGVDGRAGKRDMPGHVYVLQNFFPEEQVEVDQMLAEVADHLVSQW